MGGLFALLGTFIAIEIEFGSFVTTLPESIELTVDLIDLSGLMGKCFVEALPEGRGLQFGWICRVEGQI